VAEQRLPVRRIQREQADADARRGEEPRPGEVERLAELAAERGCSIETGTPAVRLERKGRILISSEKPLEEIA
jgi:hypothetical protein